MTAIKVRNIYREYTQFYDDLIPNNTYTVIISEYMYGGGDGYKFSESTDFISLGK